MDGAGNIMLVLGKILPFDSIVDQVENAIKKYKEDKSEDNKGMMVASMTLMLSKVIGEGKDIIELSKEFEEMKGMKDTLSEAKETLENKEAEQK